MVQRAEIKTNFNQVQEEIRNTTLLAGRKIEDVKLVVVSKGHSIDVVNAALNAGIRTLGENYVEEAVQKINQIKQMEMPIEWHMIGHIQSRKAKRVCEIFDYVHSIDSTKLANRLNKFASEIGRMLPILLECNVSGEASKFGWRAWEEESWGQLLPEFNQISSLSNLEVRGLMTIAPFLQDVEATRPYFRRLRKLSEFLTSQIKGVSWQELSMGMSADYKVAIQEGASIVRIGSAILGKRP
jgi:pyridoxal phosphate enzyme (YggS family)